MKTTANLASIKIHFADLDDPRVKEVDHPLINIIVIGLCSVICGGQGFTEMESFGKAKLQWLSKFLDVSHGIPSHDTFNRVFAALKPQQFEQCLLSWVAALHEISGGKIVAIDGKTLRGSYGRGDSKAAIHMVSAWAGANHLSLGSQVVDAKSNEITAIPKLLELIDVSGALVTIDAMGCQREIAKKIREEGADYVLQVKGNQPSLLEAIANFFTDRLENDFAGEPCRRFHTQENGHGRDEERYYRLAPVPEDFPCRDEWKDLRALGVVVRFTERDGKRTDEVSYYILSRYISGSRFAEAVRGHWGIENNLHWQLDVTFREDDLRIYQGHAPTNVSILMRTALALLKNEKTNRRGIRTKRMTAGWDDTYLEQVLTSPTP